MTPHRGHITSTATLLARFRAHDEDYLGEQRVCSCCAEPWPLDAEFYAPHKASRGGFRAECRACQRERKAAERARGRVAA